jgi:predicted dehydrogenase
MINIAIIGSGGMAGNHVEHYQKIPNCRVVAACDVDLNRAKSFAIKHAIPLAYGNVEELFAQADFHAVSNVTPDSFHAPISLLALKHRKHVLCEKPLATNYADALEMAQAAQKADVINMVNFSYRNSSAIHHAYELVKAGRIGRVMHVEGHYLQSWLSQNSWGDWKTTPAWLWRLSTAHGSKGVLGDIGVHLLDFASYPVGDIRSINCRLKTFAKAPQDQVGAYHLDANDSAVITLEFASGAIGSLCCTRWATGHVNTVTLSIYGDEGSIKIDLDRSSTQLEWCQVKNGLASPWTTVDCPATPNIYERFILSIMQQQQDQPDFARGAQIQCALDASAESHHTGLSVQL